VKFSSLKIYSTLVIVSQDFEGARHLKGRKGRGLPRDITYTPQNNEGWPLFSGFFGLSLEVLHTPGAVLYFGGPVNCAKVRESGKSSTPRVTDAPLTWIVVPPQGTR
jgi:hypothetical protein